MARENYVFNGQHIWCQKLSCTKFFLKCLHARLLHHGAHCYGDKDCDDGACQWPENPSSNPFTGEPVIDHGAKDRNAADQQNEFEKQCLRAVNSDRCAAIGGSDHRLHNGDCVDGLFRLHAVLGVT